MLEVNIFLNHSVSLSELEILWIRNSERILFKKYSRIRTHGKNNLTVLKWKMNVTFHKCFMVTDNYMFGVLFEISVHDSGSANWQKWIKNETKLT
jgi:hypothetical protein